MIKILEVFNQIIKSFKSIVIIVLVLVCSYFGYIAYKNYKESQRLYKDLIGLQEDYEQINENVAKLKIKYIEQKHILVRKEKEWKEVENQKNERIKILSDATYLIGKHVGRQNGPDYYYETPKKTRNFVLNELRLDGPESPALGYILIKNDGRTYKRNYVFQVEVKNLQTIDEKTGRIKVYSKAFVVVKEKSPLAKRVDGYKNWKDIPYPLKIIDGEVLVDPTKLDSLKAKMFWWNPKFGVGMNLGVDKRGFYTLPSLEVTVLSYGKTKNDSKFKFVGIGVNLGDEEGDFDIHLKPVSYRFFELFSNTYISPGIGYTSKGDIRYLLGIDLEF